MSDPGMHTMLLRWPPRGLLVLVLAVCAACATTDRAAPEVEPPVVGTESAELEAPIAAAEAPEGQVAEGEGEVPLTVAESEVPSAGDLAEILVTGQRHELIRDLVVEGRSLLDEVQLEYFFTGKGKNEVLRGRPVVFALWSESAQEWTIAHVEIPRPPVNWKPGGKPMRFLVRTPGITATHVKGTGAERLMFAFSRGEEQLKVYGRKFPVFDSTLVRRKQWRAVVRTAQPIVYLPFTEDTFDPSFVSGGRDFLLATARDAAAELRAARVPSVAYPGELLADVIPVEVIATLAVIEQTDDTEYTRKGEGAFNEVLSQYGLKRGEAYRYSVSSASALGAMQFTNRKGNGTYALVVRRCRGANIDPSFERGATNLYNAMKAAICLLDIELSQMRPDIRAAYRADPPVLGIFPVAAYNGGPRNVTRLYNVLKRIGVQVDDLSRPGEFPEGRQVNCPCVWKQGQNGASPVSLPRYNNENRWYVEKYQAILGAFEPEADHGEEEQDRS